MTEKELWEMSESLLFEIRRHNEALLAILKPILRTETGAPIKPTPVDEIVKPGAPDAPHHRSSERKRPERGTADRSKGKSPKIVCNLGDTWQSSLIDCTLQGSVKHSERRTANETICR
jgi:hypothetical protein